jgi:2'-5' RNA ligase
MIFLEFSPHVTIIENSATSGTQLLDFGHFKNVQFQKVTPSFCGLFYETEIPQILIFQRKPARCK